MRILKAARAGLAEMTGFFPKLLSLLRELWLEVIGFVFFALALFFALSANGVVQSFQKLESDPEAMPSFLLALVFFIMFAYFGWSSFRRARKVSRERE